MFGKWVLCIKDLSSFTYTAFRFIDFYFPYFYFCLMTSESGNFNYSKVSLLDIYIDDMTLQSPFDN